MDNHDDTHCFREHFSPISLTLEELTVSPFLPEYTEQVNITICTVVTVATIDTG